MYADFIFETNYGASFKLCIFHSLAVTLGWLFDWLRLEQCNEWLLLSNRFAWVGLVFIIIIF